MASREDAVEAIVAAIEDVGEALAARNGAVPKLNLPAPVVNVSAPEIPPAPNVTVQPRISAPVPPPSAYEVRVVSRDRHGYIESFTVKPIT